MSIWLKACQVPEVQRKNNNNIYLWKIYFEIRAGREKNWRTNPKKRIAAAKAQSKGQKYIYSQWCFDASMSQWEWQNEKYNLQFGQCSKISPVSVSRLSPLLTLLVQRSCIPNVCTAVESVYFFSLPPSVLSLLEKSTFVRVGNPYKWMDPKCKRTKKINVYLFRLWMCTCYVRFSFFCKFYFSKIYFVC